MSLTLSAEQFVGLVQATASTNIYVLGTIERRLTVRAQMIRALNLVHALFETNRLHSGDYVTVVGAGFAGVTAAAAFAHCGCYVTLYEKNDQVLHLQNQCETRFIHPHIYDWPDQNSLRVDAELPFCNWYAERARDVAGQVARFFDDVKKRVGDDRLTVRLSADPTLMDIRLADGRMSFGYNGASRPMKAIVLATGFGLEREFPHAPPLSYWENDPNAQRSGTFLISGTGDGGLIDLLRVKIQQFRQDSIVTELFSEGNGETKKLLDVLRAIKANMNTADDTYLSVEYHKLHVMAGYQTLKANVASRLREDTTAWLHGTDASFAHPQSSMLHSLLVHVLHDLSAFKYQHKKLKRVVPAPRGKTGWTAKFDGGAQPVFDEVIIRHGAVGHDTSTVVGEWMAKHKSRLETLQKSDLSQNYKEDLTARLLDGNHEAWWSEYGRQARDPASAHLSPSAGPPPSAMAPNVQDGANELPPRNYLRPVPGRMLALYRDLDVPLDWFHEVENNMKVGRLDSSLAYYGPGLAHAWRRMTARSPIYQFLEHFLDSGLDPTLRNRLRGRLNIVDLGIGNSAKAHRLVTKCTRYPNVKDVSYLAVDISFDMIALTLESQVRAGAPWITDIQRTGGAVIGINSAFTRIDHFRALMHDCDQTLFLLLGNTLGNEMSDGATLAGVRDMMRADDLLLVEVQLSDSVKADEMTKAFNSDDARQFYAGTHRALNCKQPVKIVVDELEPSGESQHFAVLCNMKSAEQIENPALPSGSLRIPPTVDVYQIRKYFDHALDKLFAKAGLEIVDKGSKEDPSSGRRFAYAMTKRGPEA